jgi:hypothetical protein
MIASACNDPITGSKYSEGISCERFCKKNLYKQFSTEKEQANIGNSETTFSDMTFYYSLSLYT